MTGQIQLKPSSFYEDGDGLSMQTTKWSPAYSTRGDVEDKGIIVQRVGVSPTWIRDTLDMARMTAAYATTYRFFDGETGVLLEQLPGGEIPQTGFGEISQLDEVLELEQEFANIGVYVGVDEGLRVEGEFHHS